MKIKLHHCILYYVIKLTFPNVPNDKYGEFLDIMEKASYWDCLFHRKQLFNKIKELEK